MTDVFIVYNLISILFIKLMVESTLLSLFDGQCPVKFFDFYQFSVVDFFDQD